jgi:hypothetical protein
MNLVGEKALVTSALAKLKLYQNHLALPFFEGLLSIKSIMRAACLQFKRMEDRIKSVEANLLSLSDTRIEQSKKQGIDMLEMNKILSVLVSLEDQLFQIGQHSEKLSLSDQKVVKRHSISRYHTTLGRMSSLIGLKQQPDPVALAEQGFINVHDGT